MCRLVLTGIVMRVQIVRGSAEPRHAAQTRKIPTAGLDWRITLIPKCERCRTQEARLRLEGMVNGRPEAHLYCEACAAIVMREATNGEGESAVTEAGPRNPGGEEHSAKQKWEYCLIDRSIPGISPTVVFLEAGNRRTEQITHAWEYMAVLGADGWELVGIEVAVTTQPEPDGRVTASSPVVSGTYYWFKRPLE